MMRPIRIAIMATAVAFCGAFSGPVLATEKTNDDETFRQLNLWTDVLERVRANYVEEVDEKELIEAAIRGMLSSLDPHSGYMGPEAFRENMVQTRGEYGGLGMEVTTENGVVKVIAPMDETPASRAGIMSGDYITHVDEDPIIGMTVNEAVELLRGPVGTPVTITIVRDGEDEPMEIELTRQIITISAVRHRIERDDIAYIRLTTFNNEKLSRDLRRTFREIREEKGGDLTGIVLDLRNNPGGLLDQAIEVSDLFLNRGEIVSMRGRDNQDYERWNASPGDLVGDLPIVVLVNAGTASASEIVTGALQDHRRATVLGTRTFGKGLVQSVIPLGPESALRLTTARYYTPSGKSIQAVGISPDIELEQPSTSTRKRLRESDLQGHLINEKSDATPEDDENDTGVNRPKPQIVEGEAPQDYQLNYALDLLEGILQVTGQRQAVVN